MCNNHAHAMGYLASSVNVDFGASGRLDLRDVILVNHRLVVFVIAFPPKAQCLCQLDATCLCGTECDKMLL
jgi:hypothetical protein